MAKKRNNRKQNPKTKMFNKGFQQAAKKRNNYLPGDLVLDILTLGMHSVIKR